MEQIAEEGDFVIYTLSGIVSLSGTANLDAASPSIIVRSNS